MNALEYLIKIKQALVVSLGKSNVYHGEAGALRLAREIGTCLQDFEEKEAYEAFRNSYNYVCVMGYNLKPPINKKEWDEAVLKGMRRKTNES
ncbi:hypothetical protein [Siminovitchia fortis]|uniref:hypothetical protein n=1 Tax=Siminovitchia fortis TaxID=254758 RepID=UPI0011AAB9FE|nr:hypothetical protein [Siminovitchia fortis]